MGPPGRKGADGRCMRIDMCIDMCVNMCIDTCIGVCIDMCVAMYRDLDLVMCMH